ncbi:hypothetical protein [Vibrio mediterranei]|uniref:hypothetical protein n=1 Tax=Vibrio mediterranei TaxID=689 RepID=UPI004068B36C
MAQTLIKITMVYTNHSVRTIVDDVYYNNDTHLNDAELSALFDKVDRENFHATRYGICSPAKYDYEWQSDAEEHCMVRVANLEVVNMCFTPERGIDNFSKFIPLLESGGYADFDKDALEGLECEITRLTALREALMQN